MSKIEIIASTQRMCDIESIVIGWRNAHNQLTEECGVEQ